VPGLEHAGEGQVAVLAYKSTYILLVRLNLGIACALEIGGEPGLDRFADGFTT
jgi:hypothetical protein